MTAAELEIVAQAAEVFPAGYSREWEVGGFP